MVFDFGEELLNRVQVWTIGRQEEQPSADGTDHGADFRALMATQVIDHDDVA
jgi:hypothetical protein